MIDAVLLPNVDLGTEQVADSIEAVEQIWVMRLEIRDVAATISVNEIGETAAQL